MFEANAGVGLGTAERKNDSNGNLKWPINQPTNQSKYRHSWSLCVQSTRRRFLVMAMPMSWIIKAYHYYLWENCSKCFSWNSSHCGCRAFSFLRILSYKLPIIEHIFKCRLQRFLHHVMSIAKVLLGHELVLCRCHYDIPVLIYPSFFSVIWQQ